MSSTIRIGRDDVIELAGQVCALARAGVGDREAWPLLASVRGPAGSVAAVVAGMIAVGGTASEGMWLAAERSTGPGSAALGWLAVTLQVSQGSGAPAAGVLDQVGEALQVELARAGEREVALAAPVATATVLATMPLLGAGLGLMLGVDTPAVLLGTLPGQVCLALASLLWAAGRSWFRRLVAAAQRAGA